VRTAPAAWAARTPNDRQLNPIVVGGEMPSPWVDLVLAENPHIPFTRRQRGYVRCRITRDAWHTDYQVVPFVSRPDAPVVTDATFVVEAGRRGLQPG
jgi:phosphodiesterase/alkaline phosphatase D-like protein